MYTVPSSTLMDFDAIPLAGVRAALFDLDDTLYAYAPAHMKALTAVYEHLPRSLDFATFEQQYSAARNTVIARLKPQGACRSRLFAFQLLCESWGIPAAFQHAVQLDHRYWQFFIAAMQPDAGAMRLIARCRAARISLCIISDMLTSWQVQKLAQLGLTERIDYLVTSEEVGAEKPDPRMFEAALTKLGLSASEVIMLGDSWEKDVQGATALGIRAYHVRAAGTHA